MAYCDQYGEGKRDPLRHDDSFINAFLASYHSGVRVQTEGETLSGFTRVMIRRSPAFLSAWSSFCAAQGGGRAEPEMHDANFHLQFFEYLAQVAAQGIQPSQAGDGVQARAGDDPVKCALVQQCKQFQRRGDMEQQAWWAYCDSSYSGIRDPSRHDVNSLSNFLALYMDGGTATLSSGGSMV